MTRVADVLGEFERFAPWRLAFEWDRVGLQVGDPGAEVRRAVVALDRSLGAVRFAVSERADLLVTHHPLLWDPLKAARADDHVGFALLELARAGVAHVAAHTNWDCASGGVSDVMAGLLDLRDVVAGGMAREAPHLKLVTFVQAADVDRLIDAMSSAGAGHIGRYERCAFYGPGTGTFLGGEGATPTVGLAGRVERVDEMRLEMTVPADRVDAVRNALIVAHPYEEPAYEFCVLRPVAGQGSVRTGDLTSPITIRELVARCDTVFATRAWAWGDPDARVGRVAVAGGAADKEWRVALAMGAQAFVTGEVRHETALEASESGLAILAAGHYATENPACAALRDRLAESVEGVEWLLYEPSSGLHGRPF